MADQGQGAKGLVALLEEGAREAFDKLEEGVGKASNALATPESADVGALVAATDLPSVASASDGPLGMLAERLDREADLHRSVALRELTRVAWMSRVMQSVVVVAVVVEIVIAGTVMTIAWGGNVVDGRGAMLALAALIVGGAAGGAAMVSARMRRAHVEIANDALARARTVEEKLFRVALAQQWRSEGSVHFQDALARLEGDGGRATT